MAKITANECVNCHALHDELGFHNAALMWRNDPAELNHTIEPYVIELGDDGLCQRCRECKAALAEAIEQSTREAAEAQARATMLPKKRKQRAR